MSAEFSGGYGSIRRQSGGNEDERGSSGAYQSEGNFYLALCIYLSLQNRYHFNTRDISLIQTSLSNTDISL